MKNILASSLLLFASVAFGADGALSTLKFDPPVAKAGQEVKITIGVDGEPPSFCGMVVHFDDGTSAEFKIDGRERKLPMTISKVYAKAGSYSVKAEGKKVTTHFPCVGAVEQRLTVEGGAMPGAMAGAGCPEGYAMKGKMAKSGAFICAAGKGAKKPEKVMDCANGLEYFQTKTALGCRKAGK